MRKFLSASLALIVCGAVCASAYAQDATPSPTPSASPTPVPVCDAAGLDAYASCVSACDSASSAICAASGSEAHYLSFLKSSLANCSYPGLDKEREFNALKDIIQGFRQMGSLSGADAKSLRQQVNVCRKAAHNHGGHHNENHGGGNGKN